MIEISLECNCDFRSLNRNKTLMTQFYDYMQKIANPVMNFMSSMKESVVSLKQEMFLQHIVYSKWMSPILKDCTWLVHYDEDNIITNKESATMTIQSSGKIISSGMYEILDNVVLTCEKGEYNDAITGFVPQDVLPFYLAFYEIVKPATPLEDCIWTIYQPTDIEYYDQIFVLDEFGSIIDSNLTENDSISVSGESYQYEMYYINYNGIVVCTSNLIEMIVRKFYDILLLVAVIFKSLSMYSLLVYSFIFKMMDESLKLQLVISCLLTHISLTTSMVPLIINVSDACTINAIILTNGILANFTWINIIVVDTWLFLRPSAADGKHSFLVHYIVGWGIPLAFREQV